VSLRFKGKSGVEQEVEIRDPRVARVVRQCLALPGRDLLAFRDETGKVRDVTSAQVNAYLQEIAGEEFTAKEFRTWHGTVLALKFLGELDPPETPTQARREMSQAIGRVSEVLGNTKAVCRRSYVHPGVLQAYESGKLARLRPRSASQGLGAHERLAMTLVGQA
jgi:DNA topoisomerase-1